MTYDQDRIGSESRCIPRPRERSSRYHRTMKNIIRLEHCYSPEELEAKISEIVEYYNIHRYHESLNNVTPADVYFGRDQEVLEKRRKITQQTLFKRRMDFILSK